MKENAQDEKRILSEAARIIGSRKSPRKAAAARENGKKGGPPLKPLDSISCTCGGTGLDHKAGCSRGRAIRYRQKKGLALE